MVHDNANVSGAVSALSVLPGGGLFAGIAAAVQAIPSMPQSGKMVVNAGNILGAAKIIQTQVDALMDSIADHGTDLYVQAAGFDSVSRFAADKWNENLVTSPASYRNRVQQYVDSLNTVLDQLRDAAVQYGFTEEEITESFGKPSAK